LIEVQGVSGPLGATVRLIYKRLEVPAYIFTGMLILPDLDMPQVWTVVSGERGTTGLREATVTAELFNAGSFRTREDYERLWAKDPYDSTYSGVDHSFLRFMSDDSRYDERFPQHPLSKVRRLLTILPSAVRMESAP
jgi:hypothetical protein